MINVPPWISSSLHVPPQKWDNAPIRDTCKYQRCTITNVSKFLHFAEESGVVLERQTTEEGFHIITYGIFEREFPKDTEFH